APGLRLRFATVSVDQFRSGSGRERNIRPVLPRVAGFEWRPNHAGGDELVEAARRGRCRCAWRDQLRNHPTMSRDRNTFAGLNSPDVAAQAVLELTDACGGHAYDYSHMWPHVTIDKPLTL